MTLAMSHRPKGLTSCNFSGYAGYACSPVACRGYWMPGTNEVLGCPRIFSNKFLTKYSSRKFCFFSHLPKFLTFSHQFSNFTKIRSLDAPSSASYLGQDIFLVLFSNLPTFLYENWPLGCPQGVCPGRRTVRTPSARH